jgi:excisionase family DNA binding protein
MPPHSHYQPPAPSPDPLLTTLEVAARLRCSKRTVQRWVKRGLLPAPIRLSTQKRLWRESDIRKVLADRASASAS